MAGFLPVQDILGAPNLIGLIKTQKSGIPNTIPDSFYNVDKQVEGDKASYFAAPGQRKTSRVTAYGGTPTNYQTLSMAEQQVKMIHTYHTMNLNPLMFQKLLQYDRLDTQQMGAQEVNRHVTDFKKIFANTRIAAMAMTLFNGKIGYDAAGNLVPPGGSVGTGGTTMDWLIPDGSNSSPWGITVSGTQSSNRNGAVGSNTSIDPVASGTGIMGNTASLTWATNTVDIADQFTALRRAAAFQHGYDLTQIFYGSKIPSYLSSNIKAQSFMSKNVVVVNSAGSGLEYLKTAEIPSGTFGFDWQPGYKMFFDDQNGVHQPLLGPSQIMVCPAPDPEWIGVTEGSFTVPIDVWRKYPEMDAFNAFQMVYGMFSYSIPTMAPPTASMFFGDTFLPILKNPSVCYIINVA